MSAAWRWTLCRFNLVRVMKGSLIHYDQILIKGKHGHGCPSRCCVKVEAEIRVMSLQPRDPKMACAPEKLGEARDSLPHCLYGNQPHAYPDRIHPASRS